jgi:hypothetical protein
MKVVVRSQSLWFTVLSIILNVPISRVKRKVNVVERKPVARIETGQTQESKYWNRVAL